MRTLQLHGMRDCGMHAATVLVSVLVFVCTGQVYNTGQTLSPGHVGFTAAPIVFIDDDPHPGGYAMFGVGLPAGLDLSLNARLGRGRTLFGADIEWGILRGFPSFSITTGFHGFDYAGLDATVNLAFPVRQVVAIYGGVDSDFDFVAHDDVNIPVWGFGGVEIRLIQHLRLIMEADIRASPDSYHMFGGGIVLYL